METFYEKEEATTRSKIVTINDGNAPSVTLVDYVTGPQGAKRHFVQQVPINDIQLLKRLLTEVKEGDEIEATIVNECRETRCTTYLAEFKKTPDVETPDVEQEIIARNGAISITRNDLTEIVVPRERDPKAKVRH